MRTIGPRRAAALLAVLALLWAAVPAAAAPREPGSGPPPLESLASCLAALWTGAAAGPAPERFLGALGLNTEPDGAPAAGKDVEPMMGAEDEPTTDPELGPVADPDG